MVWVTLASGALAACAADGASNDFGNGSGANGSGANGSGAGSGVDLNGDGNGSGSGGDGGLGDDEKCAETTADANRAPAIIEMVIDTSGSMGFAAPNTALSRWDVTKSALSVALDNLAAKAPDTAIGLSFFPNDAKVSIFDCYFPEQTVPISELTPQQVQALKNGFTAAGIPSGGTPTHNAYHYSAGQLRSSPLEGNRYMLLITDGKASFGMSDPNNPGANCTGNGSDAVNVNPLLQEVTTLFNAEGIKTFVVGVPGSEDFTTTLSEMARVGGTGDSGCGVGGGPLCHFDMTTEPDLATGLANALADISGQALSCTYTIPTPDGDQVVDYGKVNVIYTPPGGTPSKLSRDGETDCGEGWQFSADKTQVLLCGPTCDEIMENGGSIEIEFGCTQIFG